MKCKDEIVRQNVERIAHMGLKRNLIPAVPACEGIAYQYMTLAVFDIPEEAVHGDGVCI